jgi:protein-L-isoaspartate(D-aspartate) O-methyltransferase
MDRGSPNHEALAVQRQFMVDEQIARRGVRDEAVLAAMRTVPRHEFVDPRYLHDAYRDGPLPIGSEQTISQPYVVASMTEHLQLDSGSRVLEVGTGSGYQAAVLAEIAAEVYSVEIILELYERASEVLTRLAYRNIHLKFSDGSPGWPEHAPYDGIIVTAAAPRLPEALIAQLAEDGRLVIPIQSPASGNQELYVFHKTAEGVTKHFLYDVRFVPMRGDVEK